MTALYQEKRPATKVDVSVRNMTYRVYTWGKPQARPMFLLHGWADAGLSFQFLVDELAHDWFCIAPDWRGFGDSSRSEAYWFPDYLLDLDILIDHFSSHQPVALVGHSMGSNIAGLYAGVCPDKVSQLVCIDALGMPAKDVNEAPERYAKWLQQMRTEIEISDFADWQALSAYIKKLAPGVSPAHAGFIARAWADKGSDGRIKLKTDSNHKRLNPVLYRREESLACWRQIRAKVALILAQDSSFLKAYEEHNWREECLACIPQLQEYVIANSGHMLHMEQPAELARLVEQILLQD